MAKSRTRVQSINKKNVKKEPVQPNKKLKIVAVVLVIAVASIFAGLYHFGYLTQGKSASTANNQGGLPSSVKTGYFAEVSTSSFAPINSVNIYFLSWKGCPIGAAESWFIYNVFNNYSSSVSSHIQFHTSDPYDVYPGTPGLLFSNFSISHSGVVYNFKVIYVYGQTLPNGTNLIASGLDTLKANTPSTIYNLFYEYQTEVPASSSGKPISSQGGHLTSSMIVTGHDGTYYLEGAPYDFGPANLSGYTSASQVLNNITSIQPIVDASTYFQQILNVASA